MIKPYIQTSGCQLDYKNAIFECVYWDFSLNNGNGDWNTDGCKYEKNGTYHVCKCIIFGNFGLRMVWDIFFSIFIY